MDSLSRDVAWSVVQEVLDEFPELKTSKPVWISRTESCDALRKVLAGFSPLALDVFETFRPQVKILEAWGYASSPVAPLGREAKYELALFVPTQQRAESLGILARALKSLSPKGKLIFVCANAQGAGGFLSRLKEVAGHFEAGSSQKCRTLLLGPEQIRNPEVLDQWMAEAAAVVIPGTNFLGEPGIFGWNKVDRGSELLISTLPTLKGVGADLGSGYGLLAHAVLEKSPEVSKLHLVEAEFRALECARLNLGQHLARCDFHWLDVVAIEGRKAFRDLDFIVMNPPFHEGSRLNHDIGRSFIETAAGLLRPGGRLFLVANAFLGYEDLLTKHFKTQQRVLLAEGFKVIHAQL